MADKRTTYHRIVVMISDLPDGAELYLEALKKMILMKISSNEKSIQKTIKLMMMTGLIESIDAERFIIRKNGNV